MNNSRAFYNTGYHVSWYKIKNRCTKTPKQRVRPVNYIEFKEVIRRNKISSIRQIPVFGDCFPSRYQFERSGN